MSISLVQVIVSFWILQIKDTLYFLHCISFSIVFYVAFYVFLNVFFFLDPMRKDTEEKSSFFIKERVEIGQLAETFLPKSGQYMVYGTYSI